MPARERRLGARLAMLFGLGSCDFRAERPAITEVERVPPVVASEAERVAADRHIGRFRFAGGEAERAALFTAIDDVVADMNVLSRSIARKRLRAANHVPERIEISRDGDLLLIHFDERRYAAPLDGSPVEVTGVTGDKLRYRVSVAVERLRQHFVGDAGGRENTLSRSGEDDLVLNVDVTSDSLPKPLTYHLSFSSELP